MASADELTPDLYAELESLADALGATDDNADLARRFEYVIDLLIGRGALAPGHRRLIDKVRAHGERAPVRLSMYPDKHRVPNADIDCAAHLHLCKARCCTFTLSLAAQDVVEGKLRWVLDQPYMLPKADHGYCIYFRREGGCEVYADRPGTCRSYDCREDRRVWLDFDKKIPAPMPDGVVPMGGWPPDNR